MGDTARNSQHIVSLICLNKVSSQSQLTIVNWRTHSIHSTMLNQRVCVGSGVRLCGEYPCDKKAVSGQADQSLDAALEGG